MKYGELKLLVDSVCLCKAATKSITKSRAGIHSSPTARQPRSFGSYTRAQEKADAERPASARPGLTLALGLPHQACPSRLLYTPPPVSLPVAYCWPRLLLLDGPSPPRKQHVLERCLQSPHPRQARTQLTNLPTTLTVAQRDCQGLLTTLFNFHLGVPARAVFLRITWRAC